MENLCSSCYGVEKMEEADDEVKRGDTTLFTYPTLPLS